MWWLAGVLFVAEIVRGVPQPLKIQRAGRIDGVSPTSTALVAVMSLVWLVYAVWISATPTIVSGIAAAATTIWCAVLVARLGPHTRLMLRVAAAASTVAAAVGVGAARIGLGPNGLAIVIIVATAAYGVPRLITGLSAPSLAGVSPAYLLLNIADAAVFGTIGVLVGAPGYVGYAVVQTIASLPVLLRWILQPGLRAV